MTNIPKLFVVEYSLVQNATHIRTLRAVIENNRSNLLKGLVSDYVPIGLLNSRAEADSFKVAFQQTLDEQAHLEFKSRNWHHISEILDKLLPKDLNLKSSEE